MTIEKKEVARRIARFEQVCRDAGVKLTHQRMEIFRELARTDDHPDAETVYQGVRKRIPTVSLDTVYRALWLLDELGLVNRLGPARERTRFDANLSRHHHFVCVKCGLTRDILSDAFDGLRPPRSLNDIGHVETMHVEVRGICHGCAKKNKTRHKTRTKKEKQS